MVGYARTATIRAMEKPTKDGDAMTADRVAYYRYVEEGHQPSIMVIQDIDSRPGAPPPGGARCIPPCTRLWAASAS